jgi:hypothetical protein
MAFYRTAYSLVSTYVPQIAQRLLFGQPGVYCLNLSGICRSKGMCLNRVNILGNQNLASGTARRPSGAAFQRILGAVCSVSR